MRSYIISAVLLLMSGLAAAEQKKKSLIPLPACGGHIELERSDLQVVLTVKEVVLCPYIIIDRVRQSMQLSADGTYEHFYVWHEAGLQRGPLELVVHAAESEPRDAVDIRESPAVTVSASAVKPAAATRIPSLLSGL